MNQPGEQTAGNVLARQIKAFETVATHATCGNR